MIYKTSTLPFAADINGFVGWGMIAGRCHFLRDLSCTAFVPFHHLCFGQAAGGRKGCGHSRGLGVKDHPVNFPPVRVPMRKLSPTWLAAWFGVALKWSDPVKGAALAV